MFRAKRLRDSATKFMRVIDASRDSPRQRTWNRDDAPTFARRRETRLHLNPEPLAEFGRGGVPALPLHAPRQVTERRVVATEPHERVERRLHLATHACGRFGATDRRARPRPLRQRRAAAHAPWRRPRQLDRLFHHPTDRRMASPEQAGLEQSQAVQDGDPSSSPLSRTHAKSMTGPDRGPP